MLMIKDQVFLVYLKMSSYRDNTYFLKKHFKFHLYPTSYSSSDSSGWRSVGVTLSKRDCHSLEVWLS